MWLGDATMRDKAKSRRRRLVANVLVGLLIAYLGSYLALSRRAFAESERLGCEGFYFFLPPKDTTTWRACNYGLVAFYYPLIMIEQWLGTGKCPAGEPTWKLSGPINRSERAV